MAEGAGVKCNGIMEAMMKLNRIDPATVMVGQIVYVTDGYGVVRQAEILDLPTLEPNRFLPGGKGWKMRARLEDGRETMISARDTFEDRAEAEKLAQIMRAMNARR